MSWRRFALLGAVLFAWWMVTRVYTKPAEGKVVMTGWREDWAGAEREAEKTGKERLVLFTADWCGYCTELKQEALVQPDVSELLASRFIRVKVDCTEATDEIVKLSRQLEVSGYPSMLVLDEKGVVKARTKGSMSKGEFLGWVGGIGNGNGI